MKFLIETKRQNIISIPNVQVVCCY